MEKNLLNAQPSKHNDLGLMDHLPPPLHASISLLRVHYEMQPPQQHHALTAACRKEHHCLHYHPEDPASTLWVSQCLGFWNGKILEEILEFTLEKRCISAEPEN